MLLYLMFFLFEGVFSLLKILVSVLLEIYDWLINLVIGINEVRFGVYVYDCFNFLVVLFLEYKYLWIVLDDFLYVILLLFCGLEDNDEEDLCKVFFLLLFL